MSRCPLDLQWTTRAFAEAWSEPGIMQAPLAQLSRYHQVTQWSMANLVPVREAEFLYQGGHLPQAGGTA